MASSHSEYRVPVIDLFAGPGGLGEGFSRYPYDKPHSQAFKSCLSIEKDAGAHQTLLLRSFVRQFPGGPPKKYYQLLKEIERPLDERILELFDSEPEKAALAREEALCAELGNDAFKETVDKALSKQVGLVRDWVLLGGPPCQAYSLAGRSRNRGIEDYQPEEDNRHFLYKEYLKVIADHLPSVFVMENVKGLLSASVQNERIFEQIIEDLQSPRKSLGIRKRKPPRMEATYSLFALAPKSQSSQGMLFESADDRDLTDFIIRMEEFGIPQARHRLIIVGIRDDLGIKELPKNLKQAKTVTAREVLDDLPRLRSGLSRESDTEQQWTKRVGEVLESDWISGMGNGSAKLAKRIGSAIKNLDSFSYGRGGDYVSCSPGSSYRKKWFHDRKIKGVFNHETRGHITSDLHRYLFAACYGKENRVSPSLKDYPKELLPDHSNVAKALKGSLFADRFRVQLASRPSTTITSHISKDGHYYIHYDPSQCRSLTVREAARLQTFPDNYFFCGPRTSQYVQVGNAVPPLLAHQIADIVFSILCESGVVKSG